MWKFGKFFPESSMLVEVNPASNESGGGGEKIIVGVVVSSFVG